MGNVKSKNRGHEELNENDERYFAKVHARNSATRSSRRFRKRRPGLAMMACVNVLADTDSPQQEGDDDSVILENENSSPAVLNAKPYHLNVGPLPIKMQFAGNVSTTSLSSRSKPESNPFPEETTSPTSVLLPSPREETSRLRAPRNRTTSQRRLETARSNQIQPNDSLGPSDLSITSSMSSTNHVIQDYYTEMMNEAHRESRQALFEGNRDMNRAFDAMLPSGMAWAEVTRAGRVTCIACSRSDVRDEAMGQPLLIAVGTDDGTVAVMEIMDFPSTPLHKQIDFGSNRSKKVGTVKELTREGNVRSLDFSPDGRWLVVGGDDGTACLMRLTFRAFQGLGNALNSVEVVQDFEREDRVYCVQFSPDGSLLAVGGFDGLVTIASVEQFDNSKEPPQHARPMTLQKEISRPGLVLSLDWSPDGTMLAMGGSDKRCTIFDDSWQIVSDVQGNASVTSVKWNPVGNQVAVGCSDGTVAVVNIKPQSKPGDLVHRVEKTGSQQKDDIRTVFSCSHTGEPRTVNALSWSPDGHFLAIGGSDHCCSIIETGNFVIVHEIRRSGSVTSVAWNQRRLLTGDEGRYLVIGSEDRSVVIMKTGVVSQAGDSISRTTSDISDASSSYFSIGSLSQHEWILREDSFFDIEDADSFSQNAPCWSPLDSARAERVITAVSFSRHKKKVPSLYIAFASSNGTVTIKSTKDWRTVQQMSFSKTIRAVHFSRRSDFMVLGGEGDIVHIVSVSDWRIMKEVKVTSSSIHALRFSRSDERLAVGCSDGVLALLSPEDGWEITGEIDTSESGISCIDWSFRHLAVGRTDGNVDIYEAARVYANFFLPEAELTRGEGPVHSVAFGVSGQFLAVGDTSGKLGVYSRKGGWVLCHQINTPSAVLATKWSSAGRYLAFGGDHQDLGAKVVDTVSWTNVKKLHKLDAKGERLSHLDWSNDDKWLVLACGNGSSHIINTTNWQAAKSFPPLSILETGAPHQENRASSPAAIDYDSESEVPNILKGIATTRNEYINVLEGELSWHELPQVIHFRNMSEAFLKAHQEKDPAPALRNFVNCIHMLTIHSKWISAKDDAIAIRISRADHGEPVIAVLRILNICTNIMKQAMQKNGDDHSESWIYSARFDLMQRDVRRIQAWNEQWLAVDARASCIDIALLQAADEVSWVLPSPLHEGEQSVTVPLSRAASI